MTQLSPAAARKLHNEFRNAFVVGERAYKKFLEGEGWIGMGYPDYYSYQYAELKDIKFLRHLNPQIVYQMLSEGHDDMEIAIAVHGVTKNEVAEQRKAFNAGLPPDSVYERGHMRKQNGKNTPNVIVKYKSVRERNRAEKFAKDAGCTLSEYARILTLGLEL